MPRLPGRESTRREIELENVEVVSFVFDWEKYAQGKICSVVGCKHKLAGELVNKEIDGEWVYYQTCEGNDAAGGGAVGADKRIEGKRGPRYYICPCCVLAVTETGRAANGDPD